LQGKLESELLALRTDQGDFLLRVLRTGTLSSAQPVPREMASAHAAARP